MGIKINISPVLHKYTNGQRTAKVDGATVGECLDNLVKRFPGIEKGLFIENHKLYEFISIYANTNGIHLQDLDKPVKEGDELHIAVLIGGG